MTTAGAVSVRRTRYRDARRAAPRPTPPGASLHPAPRRRRVAPAPSLAHLPGAPRPAAPAPCCPAVLGPAGPCERAPQQQRRRLVTKSPAVARLYVLVLLRRPSANLPPAQQSELRGRCRRRRRRRSGGRAQPRPGPAPSLRMLTQRPQAGPPHPSGPPPWRGSRAAETPAPDSTPRLQQDLTLILD